MKQIVKNDSLPGEDNMKDNKNAFYTENWIPVEYFSHWSKNIYDDLKQAGLKKKKLYNRNDLKQFNMWCYKNQDPDTRVDIRSIAIGIFNFSLPATNDYNKIGANYKPRKPRMKRSKKNEDENNYQ